MRMEVDYVMYLGVWCGVEGNRVSCALCKEIIFLYGCVMF
jgi:hypothetical protein